MSSWLAESETQAAKGTIKRVGFRLSEQQDEVETESTAVYVVGGMTWGGWLRLSLPIY